jgi:hypothetical protein
MGTVRNEFVSFVFGALNSLPNWEYEAMIFAYFTINAESGMLNINL